MHFCGPACPIPVALHGFGRVGLVWLRSWGAPIQPKLPQYPREIEGNVLVMPSGARMSVHEVLGNCW